MADTFIFLDNTQLPGKGQANRNYIKGKDESKVLLTVPLKRTKGMHSSYIEAVPDYKQNWQKEHLNKLTDAYKKAPHFDKIFSIAEALITEKYESLSAMNIAIIKSIADLLDIRPKMILSSQLEDKQLNKNQRNIDLVKQVGGLTYLSGQGAKKYNDDELFANNQIGLSYQSFELLIYQQVGNEFLGNLSVLDILFNVEIEEIKHKLRS